MQKSERNVIIDEVIEAVGIQVYCWCETDSEYRVKHEVLQEIANGLKNKEIEQ